VLDAIFPFNISSNGTLYSAVYLNIYFERNPCVDPGSGTGCSNPFSNTLIKCVFWGGPVTSANAANTGQWRGDFYVVMAGSNGYINSSINDAAGYTTPAYFGNSIVNAPLDCNARNSSLGWKLYNDGLPFDAGRCAAACTALSNLNIANAAAAAAAADSSDATTPALCTFFNTYIINQNNKPLGQMCQMYSAAWSSSHATTTSQVDSSGNVFTFSFSYAFTNATSAGPCGTR